MKMGKIKKRKQNGKFPGNIAKPDKMEEMAKFRKEGKTRAGEIVQNLGSAKGLFGRAQERCRDRSENRKIENGQN